ncbi:unnamed protein product [Caenorhabditis bovis]|uniref:Uncharacterized protein n=1 Tax=Caenorhabditis bovis TaxID=2654633 RepID=A0A8S1ESJ0_9PELO|nr:unnamed protein product [Caenorhabditis bovis]
MFIRNPVLLDALYCISSALIGISITGLYLKRPSLMLPDVLYKNYFLFNAIAVFYREQDGLDQTRPPPSYNLFAPRPNRKSLQDQSPKWARYGRRTTAQL